MKYSEGKKNISFNVLFRFAHTYTHTHTHAFSFSLSIFLSKHTLARLGHNASLAFYLLFVYVVFFFFFFFFFFFVFFLFLFFCHSPPLHSPIRRNKCTFTKTYLYLMYTRAAPLTKTHEKERGKKKKGNKCLTVFRG